MKVSTTGYKRNSKDKKHKQLYIPGDVLTMLGVDDYVQATPVYPNGSYGGSVMMKPGVPTYNFPGAAGVIEQKLPQAQLGLIDKLYKRRVLNQYPAMQNVYGPKGENLNIIRDRNFDARSHGFGDIEFVFPGSGTVNYSDDYTYQSPTPDKYTAVYNPKGAKRGDVFLDMLHGMRDDPSYQQVLQNFSDAVRTARDKDMDYFYDKDVASGWAVDGRESWDKSYIDGMLRAELSQYAPGRVSGESDYKIERTGASPEMQDAARDIYDYLRLRPKKLSEQQQGGSLPKAQKGKEWEQLGYENKVYTYKDNPEFFDNHARLSDNPRYNDWIKQTVYSGKWGYNPVTGESVRLDANQQATVDPITQNLSKDKRTFNEVRKTDKAFDQYLTEAEKESGKAVGRAQSKAMVSNPAFYAPGVAGALAVAPELLGAELFGTGLSVGNIMNPIFFGQGVKNTLDSESDMRKSWSKAYNDPSKSNLLDATVETGLNSLNFLGAGSVGSDLNKMGNFVGKQFNAVRSDIDVIRNAGKYARDMQWQTADDVFNLGNTQQTRQLGSKQLALPGSPNTFKSEIDWAKWNKEIPNNSELVNEYNTIEQTAKTNGTWMKNPDGSQFKGTPEQFVQENSQNFKNAYPEGYDIAYRGEQYNVDNYNRGNKALFMSSNEDVARLYAKPSDPESARIFHPDINLSSNKPNHRDDYTYGGLKEFMIPKNVKRIEGTGSAYDNLDDNLKVREGLYDDVINNWDDQVRKGLEDSMPLSLMDFNKYKERQDYLSQKKLSTDIYADYLMNAKNSESKEPLAVIKDIYDGSWKIKQNTVIANPDKLNIKSRWYNNGMFDMKNPNVYAYQIRGLSGPATMSKLTDMDVDLAVARNKAWLNSDEYVRRRSANTGETPEQVRASVSKILNDTEDARFYLNASLGKTYGEMTPKSIFDRYPRVDINKATPNAKNTLEHEVVHLYSPVVHGGSDAELHKGLLDPDVANLPANKRGVYANYPSLGETWDKTSNSINLGSDDNYLKLGHEQQARHLSARNQIIDDNNLPIDTQLTEEQVKPLVDKWVKRVNDRNSGKLDIGEDMDYDEIWLQEALKIREGLLKNYGVKSDMDLSPEQALEYRKATRDILTKNITDVLNKAWVAVPVGIGIGAVTQQKKKGGPVNKRSHKDLDNYFAQAWSKSRKTA